MLLIAWVVLSGPWAGSRAAISEAKAAALLPDLAQKSQMFLAVAEMIAAVVNELVWVVISEHWGLIHKPAERA